MLGLGLKLGWGWGLGLGLKLRLVTIFCFRTPVVLIDIHDVRGETHLALLLPYRGPNVEFLGESVTHSTTPCTATLTLLGRICDIVEYAAAAHPNGPVVRVCLDLCP